LELAAAAFLAASAAAGFGITYLSGVPFRFEERIVFGAVVGPMVVAATSFAVSLLARDVTVLTVSLGFLVTVVGGAVGLFIARARLASDWTEARRRWASSLRVNGHPWPLLAVMLVCGAWTVHLLHQAWVYTPSGLYAGYVNIWGDWSTPGIASATRS